MEHQRKRGRPERERKTHPNQTTGMWVLAIQLFVLSSSCSAIRLEILPLTALEVNGLSTVPQLLGITAYGDASDFAGTASGGEKQYCLLVPSNVCFFSSSNGLVHVPV